MYGGIAPTSPLTYGLYLRGKDQSGNIFQLIGVNPTSGKVQIDPLAVGANFGGNVLLQDPAAYLNWDTIVGALGYGIRGNAGTVEFKNSAGAWAPIAAAAASAGGWTDDGTIVRLDTGTDNVGIGTATNVTQKLTLVGGIGFASADGVAPDGIIVRTAANNLAMQNGTANQQFNVGPAASFLRISKNNAADATIRTFDSTNLNFGTADTSYWQIVPTGGFIPITDNARVLGDATHRMASVAFIDWLGAAGSVLTVNDAGADVDFRIESDTNANHFQVDAGAYAGVGAFGFGVAASVASRWINIQRPAVTAVAGQNWIDVYIVPSGAVTIPTGNAAVVASLQVHEPNITLVGTVTDAYSLHISGAPTEGTNNGALNVAAGQVRFQGMPTAAAGLPAGTLWNNSGVVNIV